MRHYLFLGLIFLLSCETKESQIQRFLIQGNQALIQQDYEAAEYYLQESLNLEPCFADALNNLGVLNSQQKHFDVAIDYFNKTLECNSEFLAAYFNRANALYESKEYYGLLKDAEVILSMKPDTASGVVLKGLALTKLRKYDEALASFSKAISLEPDHPEHWVNRGTVRYYQKKYNAAAADFKKSLYLQPNQANAINALGLIAADQLKYDSARHYFEQALNIIPNEPYFLNNLGFVFLKEEQFDKALEKINLSITLDPDNAWAYRNKGIYYLQKEDYKNSIRLLKQSLTMDESVDKIHFYYAQALLRAGDTETGCGQLKIALENNEGDFKNEDLKRCL